MSLSGVSLSTGLTYQWQSSPDNATWTNIGGATASTYTATINAPVTYFRCVVTCSNSGLSANSASVLVNGLYCASTFTNTTYYIRSFSTSGAITNINNVTNAISPSGYGNFTNLAATASPGTTLNFNAGLSTTSAATTYGFAIYIDWNNNLSFADAGELVYNSAAYLAPPIIGSFAVPAAQTPGNYRMRIVADYLATSPAACNARSDGETEDYTLTVPPLTPCAGLPTGGVGAVTPSTGASGIAITLSASSVSYNSGLAFQWEVSTDGGITWSNVAGANTQTASATVPAGTINSTIRYRLKVTCSSNGQVGYSTPAVFTFGGYCIPVSTTPGYNYITQVNFVGTLQDISNSSTFSANPAGYQNFTGLTLRSRQAQGSGINISVLSNFRALIRAWVDWNADGTFAAAEQVYYSNGVLTTSTTFGFVVPAATTPGLYRFRIRTTNTGASTFDACSAVPDGETEDYLFQVVPACTANILSATGALVCGSGTATISVTSTPSTTQYYWYAAPNATIPVAITATPTWTTPAIVRTEIYYVTAVNASCESVEKTPVRVSYSSIPQLSFNPANPLICGDGSIIQLNATGDQEDAFLINESFEAGTLGGFTVSNIISNAAAVNAQTQWQVQSSTYVPSNTSVWRPAISSGIGSNKFAYATSDIAPTFPASNTPVNTALVSGALNSTNFTDLYLDFSVFYSHYLADGVTSIPDSLNVEVSTNGGSTWTLVQAFIEDQGIGTRFFDYSVNLTSYINQANLRLRIRYRGDWCDGVAIDDVKLHGLRPLSTSYSWSPLTGNNLFLNAAGTIPYTGGSVPNIYVKPTPAQLDTGGIFIFTATATLSNGCQAASSVTVTVSANQWTGTAGPDWNNINNWCSRLIPTVNTRVEIPAGVPNFPVINTAAVAKSVKILSGASLTINAAGSLSLKSHLDNIGTLTNNGRIELNGSEASPQTFPGPGLISAMSILQINNTGGGVSVNKSFQIETELRPTAGSFILNAFDVTLKSSLAKTAFVSVMGTGASFNYNGTGRFIVERYIPTGQNHAKSWQFLSVPTSGPQTIREAWQEGATPGTNPVPGFGTSITTEFGGSLAGAQALGFDNYNALPGSSSMKILNNSVYSPISSTSVPIQTSKGYFVFVRGDRSANTFSAPATPTRLRTRGKLYDNGANPPPAINIAVTDSIISVGNPYASPIDFVSIDRDAVPGVDAAFWVWDPLRPGTFGLGGFQYISADNDDFKPFPGGTIYYPSDTPNSRIQPGQAFLIENNGSSGALVFDESVKSSTGRMVFRGAVLPSQRQQIKVLLTHPEDPTQLPQDAAFVTFHPDFNNGYDTRDGVKMFNVGENIGFTCGGKYLIHETRRPAQRGDTLYLFQRGMRTKNYRLRLVARNLNGQGHSPRLYDRFARTYTTISTTDTTNVDFMVTAGTASAAENRFCIVWSQGSGVAPGQISKSSPVANPPQSQKEAGIQVVPNPVQGRIAFLQYQDMPLGAYQMRITDPSGHIVRTDRVVLSSPEGRLPLELGEGLSSGMYLVEMAMDGWQKKVWMNLVR